MPPVDLEVDNSIRPLRSIGHREHRIAADAASPRCELRLRRHSLRHPPADARLAGDLRWDMAGNNSSLLPLYHGLASAGARVLTPDLAPVYVDHVLIIMAGSACRARHRAPIDQLNSSKGGRTRSRRRCELTGLLAAADKPDVVIRQGWRDEQRTKAAVPGFDQEGTSVSASSRADADAGTCADQRSLYRMLHRQAAVD